MIQRRTLLTLPCGWFVQTNSTKHACTLSPQSHLPEKAFQKALMSAGDVILAPDISVFLRAALLQTREEQKSVGEGELPRRRVSVSDPTVTGRHRLNMDRSSVTTLIAENALKCMRTRHVIILWWESVCHSVLGGIKCVDQTWTSYCTTCVFH